MVNLPHGVQAQFLLFQEVCMKIKRLSEQIPAALLAEQDERNHATTPKALDNAIVNYVRIVSASLPVELEEDQIARG